MNILSALKEGVSADRETPSGKTALLSAAEEDPGSLGHTWVQNEEGWDVLAVALLLDRRMYRPKVGWMKGMLTDVFVGVVA